MLRALWRGQQRAALITSPQTTVPPSLGSNRRRCPYPVRAPEGTEPAARPRAGKGERSRPNKAPGTHSSRRGRTKGVFGAAEATRPLPDPDGLSAASATSAWAGASAPTRCGTSPTPHRGRPDGREATKYPWPAASPAAPSRVPQPPPAPNNGLSLAATRGRGRAGKRSPEAGGLAAPRPPPAHLPPTTRPPAAWGRAAATRKGAYFSRACPSEGTAEPLPLANMVCREEGAEPRRRRRYRPVLPSCPAPGPLPAFARSRSARRAPSLPPGAGSALFPAVKASAPAAAPSPWNSSRAGSACAVPPPPGCPPLARSLAQPPARPPPGSACAALCASGTAAAAAAAAGLLGAQPNVAARAGSAAGGNAPRRTASSANRRAGVGPGGRQGRPVSAGRGSPAAPPPRAAAAPAPGRGCTGASLGSVDQRGLCGPGGGAGAPGAGSLASAPPAHPGGRGRYDGVRGEGARTPTERARPSCAALRLSALPPRRGRRPPYPYLVPPPPGPTPTPPQTQPGPPPRPPGP